MKEQIILLSTAVTLGFFHTLSGPDHYLPFIVLSKAKRWSTQKTAFITFLCGIGHILSSVVIGILAISLGLAAAKLRIIESIRGEVAAWLLIVFGLAYFLWGLWKALGKGETSGHFHVHADGHLHLSNHHPDAENLTPWILFIIFVFGPCEPLIPLVMYPAAKGDFAMTMAVVLSFGLITIGTMLLVVMSFSYGLSKLPFSKAERYYHAIAGFVIFLSGIAIKFLGL